MAWIRKALTPLDFAIVLLAVIVFFRIDYAHFDLADYVFMVAFGLWFLLLIVRCLIYRKRENEGGGTA